MRNVFEIGKYYLVTETPDSPYHTTFITGTNMSDRILELIFRDVRKAVNDRKYLPYIIKDLYMTDDAIHVEGEGTYMKYNLITPVSPMSKHLENYMAEHK